MGFGIQLALLMWKNFTYRRRQTVQLIVEVLWPLFLFFILISVRRSHLPFEQHECHFPNKALPSAGTLSWIQSIICNVKNPCFRYSTAGETPGLVGNFNHSILSRLFADTQKVLRHANDRQTQASVSQLLTVLHQLSSNGNQRAAMPVRSYLKENETFSQFLRTNTSLPSALVEELLESQLNLRVFSLAGSPLKAVVCNSSVLSEFLVAKDAAAAEDLQKALCALPDSTLQAIERTFFSQVDLVKVFAVGGEHECVGALMGVNRFTGLAWKNLGKKRAQSWAQTISSIFFLGFWRSELTLAHSKVLLRSTPYCFQ